MNSIKFCRVGDDYGWLANAAPYPISVDGKMWYSAEHYFQSTQFHDITVQRQIERTRSAAKMLEIARNPKLRIRRDWDEVKIDFMEKAVKVKFTQLPELKKLLLETGDAELIAHSDEDSYWCDGGDGSGKNLLGMILMDLRDELREHEAKQTPRSK